MNKQEAHTLLEAMATEITRKLVNSGHNVTEQTKLLRKQLKAINMAIKALQDDWIPLNDDSAAPGYKVICQDRYENMMLGYVWVDEYGIWMCEDDNVMMDDVIAYRPLPAPYKENE